MGREAVRQAARGGGPARPANDAPPRPSPDPKALADLLVESTPDAVYAKDLEGRYTFINAAAAERLQRPRESVIGLRDADLFSPESAAAYAAEDAAIMASGEALTHELQVRYLDGRTRWISATKAPLRDATGALVGTVGVSRDITGQKLLEASLDRTQASLREAFSAVADPIIVGEAIRDDTGRMVDERILFVNQAWADEYAGGDAAAITGLTTEQVLARFPSETVAERMAIHREVIATGVPVHLSVTNPSGRRFDIEFVRFGDGVVGLHRDVTAILATRDALVASERRYRTTLDSLIEGAMLIDREWRYQYVNSVAAEHGQSTVDALIGRTMLECYPGIEASEVFGRYRRCMEQGEPQQFESAFTFGDGTTRWYEFSVSPVPTGIFVLSLDVTDRIRAQEAIREREHALVEAQHVGRTGSWRWDRAADRVEFSEEMYRLHGFDPASPPARLPRFSELASPEAAERIRAAFAQALEDGRPYALEIDQIFPDGSRRWFLHRVSAELGPDGSVVALTGTDTDITAEKEASLAALRRETEFHAIFDSAPIGIAVMASPSDRIVEANAAYQALTGRTLEELRAARWEDFTHPDDIERQREAIAARDAGDRRSLHLEKRYLRPDGSVVWVDLVNLDLPPDGDRASRRLIMVRDITAARSAESALRLEAGVRTSLATTIQRLPEGAGAEAIAGALAGAIVDAEGLDLAALFAATPDGTLELLGGTLDGAPLEPPLHLAAAAVHGGEPPSPAGRARSWAEDAAAGGIAALLPEAAGLVAVAYEPIRHAGHRIGVLVVGTRDEGVASVLVRERVAVGDVSNTISALMSEPIAAWRRTREIRDEARRTIETRAFHPVFQPIVDLQSGAVVGYEALTRFASGHRPDIVLRDAWSVGLGADLELAMIESAIEAARGLPAGRWLDVNASPRLILDPASLGRILRRADRPLVIEITEHEVIGDYGRVRESLRRLGADIRLAVDDAGAGIANFTHIVELRADFVKLDMSLVRDVNAELGRQALVTGMRFFARTSGCRLVAEGIEAPEEAATLASLGVEFGQGFLFGRPEPAEHWAMPDPRHGLGRP